MILDTAAGLPNLDPSLSEWVYNALDCAVTAEVRDALAPRIAADSDISRTYRFERALQNPGMAMQLRGFAVDDGARQRLVRDLVREAAPLQRRVDEIALEWVKVKIKWGKGLAPSTQQLQKIIYGAMGIPEYRAETGEASLGEEILEKIRKKHEVARELCNVVLSLRDMQEQIKVSKATLEPDGRMRYQVAVGQQETGRWSCTKSVWRTGTNMHGVTNRLRSAFVPDPGKVLINVDLEQAESRCVAYLARDEEYIAAHERGNVHVDAAWLAWPKLPADGPQWTGDRKRDKKIAKETPAWWVPQPPPNPGSEAAVSLYRLAKVLQHGNNYGQTYRGVARRMGLSDREGERVSAAYFEKYPGIKRWHGEVKAELAATGVLVTPFGRPRCFFGRLWEWETIKEAIAHVPQSLTSDVMKTALYRMWSEFDPDQLEVLTEWHDAVVMQVPRDRALDLIETLRPMFQVRVPIHGRELVIPAEFQVGPRNWMELMSPEKWKEEMRK